MGRLFLQFLSGPGYSCKSCGCHLAASDDLLSKGFYSRNGPAFLFDSCINVVLGEVEEREMTTGRHQVRGLYCLSCNWLLGWRYEFAEERREKYKEGRYVLEKAKIYAVDEGSSSPSTGSLVDAIDTMSLVSDVDECCYM